MLDAFIADVLAAPVKSLLGSGGVLGAVALFVGWWRGRPFVVARLLSEAFDTGTQPTISVVVHIELENHGRESTSVKPSVQLRCRSSKRGGEHHVFDIQEADRTLAPVTPKIVTLKAMVPASYVFSHFRVFKFSFSRGRTAKVRVLNASGQSTGALRFVVLEWCFRLFGALPHIKD